MKDNAARLDIGDAALDLGKRHVDKHDLTHALQVCHRLFTEHHGTAGGNDRAICVKRAAKLLLQAEKILQAVLVQYFLQRLACPAANQQINVVKQVAQRLCQQHADGALAGAGHTD